jgi:hypothetical protein
VVYLECLFPPTWGYSKLSCYFRDLREGEVRSILLLRTRVNRLSSDASGARELRILYDTQLPQVDVRCS